MIPSFKIILHFLFDIRNEFNSFGYVYPHCLCFR
jgi:hypothetical protein